MEIKAASNKIVELLKHIRIKHGRDEVTRFRITKSKFLPFQCEKCEFCFTREEVLKQARLEIPSQNPFLIYTPDVFLFCLFFQKVQKRHMMRVFNEIL